MSKKTCLTALVASLVCAPPALAQSESQASAEPLSQSRFQPDDAWSFTLGTETDNRSKNVSKSGNDGHVFGTATWESADGRFYVGPGFQGVQSAESNMELSFATGYAPEAFGYEFDVSLAYLNRVGAGPDFDADMWEATAVMRRAIGPASGTLLVQYSPDVAGPARAYTWVEAEVGWEFTRRLSGSVALGRREQAGGADYTGWNAGLTWGLTEVIDVDVRYYDTNAHAAGEEYRQTVVAGLSVAF